MHADAVPLQRVLNGNLQMIIPIFQRPYSWEHEPVETLWEDIIKLYKNAEQNRETATHFLGPIVRVDMSTSSVDTRKLLLVDGQQRIITLMVLLSCLRNFIKNKDENTVKKIESDYLLNYQEKGENYHKLIPSEGDRDNFKKIILGENNCSDGRLKDTFDFFTRELDSNTENLDFEKLRSVIVKNLILVNIDVGRDENPYLIFESLNAKGTPLTQADLIRNYIFMKVQGEEKQKELYQKYWRPMELLLDKDLENFFWRYTLKDGAFVKIKRTYNNLKTELESNSKKTAETELEKISEYSSYYSKLIDPSKEEDEELKNRFSRHNRWEIRTAYPFLLNVYKDYSDKKISSSQFCEILDTIESFVIRRFFCKESTNKLNRLFITMYGQIDKNNFIESLKSLLIKNRWPNDKTFIEGLKTFTIYTSGTDKCSLILESIEESYHHKESVDFDGLQIEHVMPQADNDPEKLSKEWKEMLGEHYKEVHKTYLHTLGNLTLTGYNQELSKKPFHEKKKLLKGSHLELNRYFDSLDKWDREEILRRVELISQQAVQIWKYPQTLEKLEDASQEVRDSSSIKIKELSEVLKAEILKLESDISPIERDGYTKFVPRSGRWSLVDMSPRTRKLKVWVRKKVDEIKNETKLKVFEHDANWSYFNISEKDEIPDAMKLIKQAIAPERI